MEVMVALGIIMVLLAAIAPALVLGIRSNALATSNTQARGLAQAELERMRNLPFHIARNAGEFIDVLDHYFPDLTAAPAQTCTDASGDWRTPSTAWRGYVTGTGRCGWEPQAGPFYRQVRETEDFVVVVATQFLSSTTPPTPVTPPAGYVNVGTVPPGADSPAATQVLARVTVFTRNGRAREPVTSSTQIGRTDLAATRVASSVRVTALEVGTTTTSGLPLSLSIGQVDLAGHVTTSSEARASLAAALTGLGTGQQAGGASLSAAAPADATVPAGSRSGGVLDTAGGCFLACWGGTSHSAATLSTANGLPNVGSPTSPVSVTLDDLSNAGFALGQGSATGYRPELALKQRLVRVDTGPGVKTGVTDACTASDGGSVVRAGAGGWLRTTAPGGVPDTHVGACGVARTAPISVLPTTFAGDGVLRIFLESSRASCTVAGGAHTPTAAYGFRAVVERWTTSGYQALAVVEPGSTGLNGLDPATYPLGDDRTLADYVASWSTVATGDITVEQADGVASVSVPGIVRIVSQPLRPQDPSPPTPTETSSPSPAETDPLSTLTLTLGTLACHAEDHR